MSDSPPLRVLLVGFGRIAQRHLSAITQLPKQLTLCGIVEPDPSCITPALIPRFTSLAQAITTARPALVVIASPSGLHAPQAAAALRAGCHVLCEKPLGMTYQEVSEIRELARFEGRRLMTCYQMRLYPTIERTVRAVRSGWLGTLHMIDARVYWARDQAYFDAAPWRGSRAMDGGVLLNQANHYVDLLTLIADEPDEVFASLPTLQRDIEAPDSAALLMRWPHMIGTLAATVLCHPKNLQASITVLGDRGSIQLGGDQCERFLRWEIPDHPLSQDERDEAETITRQIIAQGHLPLYHRLIHALHSNTPLAWEDAPLSCARLLSAAARSHTLRAPFPLCELY